MRDTGFPVTLPSGKIDVELVTLSDVTVADLKSATVRPWLGNVSIMRSN